MKLPKHVAMELVPRALDSLLSESRSCMGFPGVDCINIPELRSIEIKSHPAALHLLDQGVRTIPHFRTIDRSLESLCALVGDLALHGVQEVLLISGDPPQDPDFRPSGVTPLSAAQELRRQFPEVRLFAGFDPYRQSIRAELEYCDAKRKAGICGFFSQAFFDADLARYWFGLLKGAEFWMGISPVTTKSSRNYWEVKNKVVFPEGFTTDLQYNCALNRDLLELAADLSVNAYLMPITISATDYLQQLLPQE